jgi:hypothetical protein
MAQALVAANGLPESPLDAALDFYQRHVPQIRAAGDDCAVLFDCADHTHHAWRLAAVQQLAREAAPARVNAIVGGEEAAIAELLAYLAAAPGVTGQLLAVAGKVD